jgi:hypothetical protein
MALDSYQNLQGAVLDWLARPGDPLVAPAVPDMITMFEEEARDRLQTRFTEKTVTITPDPGSDTIALPLDYGELRSIWVNTAFGRRHLQYQTPRNLDMNLHYLVGYQAAFTIEGLNLRFVGTASTDSDNSNEVTLTPDAATTTFANSQITAGGYLGLMPQTANAADAVPSIWVETNAGAAVIHHASSPNTDQTFLTTLTANALDGAINIDYLSGIPPLSATASTNWLLQQYPSAYLWGTLAYAAPYIGDDPRMQIWLAGRETAIERIRLADRRAKFPHGLMIQTDVRNP